jgi:zinc-finger-containing domain
MRVGRPIKLLPHPQCNYCGSPALLVNAGGDGYPYRDDLGPLWLCKPCGAWIGVFARSKRHLPLGRLANAALRERKAQLHATLEPMAKAKARRDSCTIFEARAKGYRWLASQMNMDEKRCHIHLLDDQQCQKAIDIIATLASERRASEPPIDTAR